MSSCTEEKIVGKSMSRCTFDFWGKWSGRFHFLNGRPFFWSRLFFSNLAPKKKKPTVQKMKNGFGFLAGSQMCILTYFFTDNFFLGATGHTFLPTIFSTDIFTGDRWCRSENAVEIS